MNSDKETKKRACRKYIGIILLILLIAAFAFFILILRTIYPPADETLIRQEVAKILNKDPNDLTNKDFAQITKLTLKGITRDIKLLKKFKNLQELSLHVEIRKNKIPKWLISFTRRCRINLREIKYIDLIPLEKLSHLNKLELYGAFKSIEPVANIISLEDINLSGAQVTDISPLQKLTNLKKLNLHYHSFIDITPLASFTNLEELNLISTKISSIEPLRNLKNLKILFLYDTYINDIEPLRNLINLQGLYISSTMITNLEPLKELTNLESLTIDEVQNAGIMFLKSLPNLQILTFVGGYGHIDIEPLKQLTNVKSIRLSNCKNITEKQVEDLKKALPETEIYKIYSD